MNKNSLKKSQSNILGTILIILLVLAAMVIVYAVYMGLIKDRAGGIDVDILTVELKIEKPVYINYDDNYDKLQFGVSRGADSAVVDYIEIVVDGELSTGETTYIEYRKINIPGPLESRVYVLDIEDFVENSIEKITVYPVSPKGKRGIGDSYIVRGNELDTLPNGGFSEDDETGTVIPPEPGPEPPCVPDCAGNKVCGDDG